MTSRAAVPSAAAPAAGVPVVLNTSLNLRGKPIVHRLTEAVADFLRSAMSALFLAPYWSRSHAGVAGQVACSR